MKAGKEIQRYRNKDDNTEVDLSFFKIQNGYE